MERKNPHNKANGLLPRILFSAFAGVALYTVFYYALKELTFVHCYMEVRAPATTDLRLFYTYNDAKKDFSDKRSIPQHVDGSAGFITTGFHFSQLGFPDKMRLNVKTAEHLEIKSIRLTNLSAHYQVPLSAVIAAGSINNMFIKDGVLHVYPGPLNANLEFDLQVIKNASDVLARAYNKTAATVIAICIGLAGFAISFAVTRYKYHMIAELHPQYMFGLIFVLLITMPFIWCLTVTPQKISEGEQRMLAVIPPITGIKPGEIPVTLTNYVNDHFGFRNNFIKWYSMLQQDLFGNSLVPDQVIVGKSGWLYFKLPQGIPYTHYELQKIKKNVEFRRNFYNSLGIKYYIVILPNKETIYPEYLPSASVPENKPHDIDIFLSLFKQEPPHFRIIDTRKALLRAKSKYPSYYKRDTHWNFYGATNAYFEIADKLSLDFNDFSRYHPSDFNIQSSYRQLPGDLYRMLHPDAKDSMQDYDPILKPGIKEAALSLSDTLKYSTDSLTVQKTVMFTNKNDTSSLRLMVFRDSFSEYLLRNLSRGFKTSHFVWTHRFMPEPVLKEKPDIVMEILVERFIEFYFYDDTLSMQKAIDEARRHAPAVMHQP